ncbi:MAG: PAS domain S-box protein [Pseudomonadota bacterium]
MECNKDAIMYPITPDRFRVLVADDEEEYIKLFDQILSSDSPLNDESLYFREAEAFDSSTSAYRGYRSKFDVISCREGYAAVDLVKKSIRDNCPFSVAFLDVRMPPGPDGISVAKQIREIDPFIEIAIVTGYSDYSPADIVVRIPPVHKLIYIQKPFRVKEIYHFAHALSAKRQQEHCLLSANKKLEETITERTAELIHKNRQLLHEIEHRARIEEALRESEQEYRLLVEKQMDLIAKLDTSGAILFVSSSYCITLGKPQEELLGKKYLSLIDEGERETVAKAILKSYSPPFSAYVEARTVTRHGSRWYAWVFTAMLDKDGLVTATLSVGRDIAELKQAEQALKDSKKKLQVLYSHFIMAQEEERKRIASDLHDDLGQTLAVLKLRIQSIQKKLPGDHVGLFRECEETLSYINEIIEHVRRLSHDLSPAVLDDLGLVEALKSLVREFARHSQLKLTLDMENIDNLFSSASAVILYRVFQEVFTNIEKHSEANHVKIGVKKHWNQVRFVIEDDGKGFDMGKLEFKSPHESGLGFSSISERITILGGKLSVKSRPGKGTMISFSIPI